MELSVTSIWVFKLHILYIYIIIINALHYHTENTVIHNTK